MDASAYTPELLHRVGQMRVPISVFGMIYESCPNASIEAASLAIKSGNAAILRGGRVFAADRRRVCRQGRGNALLPVVFADAPVRRSP